jgi:quercetin dioxygenase-like cupin family protein
MPKADTNLIEYVLGLLERNSYAEVEREISAAAETLEELRAIGEALSSVALAEEPVSPRNRVRDLLLTSLESHARFEGFVERLTAFLDLGADRVRELLDTVAKVEQDPWQQSPLPGARFFDFDGGPRVAAARCGLVHLEPGLIFPRHRHLGDEWAWMLQGHTQDDSGQIATSGDIVYKPKGSTHSFRVLDGEPLVFVIVLYGGFEIVAE